MLLRNRIKFIEVLETILNSLNNLILYAWRILLTLAALKILEII